MHLCTPLFLGSKAQSCELWLGALAKYDAAHSELESQGYVQDYSCDSAELLKE